MTGCRFGDVVLVPFPFTDQRAQKKRPAVVVSLEEYNQKRPDIVLMAVTSQTKPAGAYGEMAVDQWRDAGLL